MMQSQPLRPRRQHYWDVTRGLLMILGVPYHAALAYRPGGGWALSSPDTSHALALFADAVHVFRMPAFFVVAGYFAAMMLNRRAPGIWLRKRFTRLGLPFVTSVTLLIPLQMAIDQSSRHSSLRTIIDGTFQSLSTIDDNWIRELWFIIVLLYFSTVLALGMLAFPALRGWTLKLSHRPHTMLVAALIATICVYEVCVTALVWKLGLATGLARDILNIPRAAQYAPFFVLGCLVERCPALLTVALRLTFPTIFLAMICLVADVWLYRFNPGKIEILVRTLAAVAWTQVIVAATRTWFDRHYGVIDKLVDASFLIYLFHMPIVSGLDVLFLDIAWRPELEWVAITAIALVTSYGLAKIAIRTPLLNAMFNGILPPKPISAPRVAAGVS